jgi:formate hydrogenlyase subunit 3/multisubunit Na+/H+ antiporter MnhD subunit
VLDVWLADDFATFTVALGGFAPPLGILFYVDELALLFALAVAVMTLLLWPTPESAEQDIVRLRVLTLLLAASSAGLALSGDLFNLYVFYELAAVASYGLIAGRMTGASFAAAFRYLLMSAMGSVFALTGIGLVYFKTGTLNLAHLASMSEQLDNPIGLAAFLLMLIGFGVKAELFPVNSWAPEVYAAASRRLSALLAGLVSKLALLVIVRLLLLVFHQPEALQAMLVLGLLTLIAGEFAAWQAKDVVRMLSWSSVGQLGLVFIAFSVSGTTGVIAGLALALHHLVVKPALFLLADAWGGSLQSLQGAARKSPFAAGLLVLFVLSLLGIPPLPGFWAKFLLLSGLANADGQIYMLAIFLVLAMTVLEANYLFRLVALLYRDRPSDSQPAPTHALVNTVSSALLAAVLLVAVYNIEPVHAKLQQISHTAADVDATIKQVFPEGVKL